MGAVKCRSCESGCRLPHESAGVRRDARAVDPTGRRPPAGAEPGRDTGGAAGHPRRPPAAPRLVRHPAPAHRHLRLRLEADPPRLRRGRQRQRHERALLVPAGDGARGGGRGRRARPGGRGLRRRPAGGAQPVAVVRAARHLRRSARRARPATSACAGASPTGDDQPGHPHRRVERRHRRLRRADAGPLRRCCSPSPTRSTTSTPIFADPFAVSLHSITRHPPPPGGRVLVWGAGALGSSRRRDPAGPLPRRRGRRWSPASTRRPTSPRSSAPTAVFRLGTQQEMVEELADVVGRRAPADDGGPAAASRCATPAASTSPTTRSASRRRSRWRSGC